MYNNYKNIYNDYKIEELLNKVFRFTEELSPGSP